MRLSIRASEVTPQGSLLTDQGSLDDRVTRFDRILEDIYAH
jgi:hypothetical protein